MLIDGEGDSTGDESLTVDSAVPVFNDLLSAETEDRESSTTPPAQKTPEPAQPEADKQDEATPEQPQSDEGESTEQEEQPEQPAENPPPSLDPSLKLKVKVAGKEEEVTLDELTKGYSRTADYTRKSQELAASRKGHEAEVQAVRAERAQYAENLKLLEQAIDEVRPKEPDWDKLRVEHPSEFPRIWAEWQQGEKDRAELRRQSDEAQRKVAEDNAKVRHERVKVEQERLLDAIPEWKDEAVRKTEAKDLAEFAQKAGYTADELNGLEDHRAIILLRKAMLFDKGQVKKTEALKRIETVRTATPGTPVTKPPVSDYTRAVQRLAKTRSQKDLQSVFMTVLDGE